MTSLVAIRRQVLARCACVPLLAAAPLDAQTWPVRPVRVVVAGPAGGSADLVARLLANGGLARELGQSIIVDPKPGAAGTIAVADLLKSPRDG